MKLTHVRKIVAEHYGLNYLQIIQESRFSEILLPRQIAMYFSHKLTEASLSKIARFYRRKDHTTTINAINKIKRMLNDEDFEQSMIELEEKILGSNITFAELRESYKKALCKEIN